MARPVDALIRAAARGVRIRMYLEPNEYANTARPGNKVADGPAGRGRSAVSGDDRDPDASSTLGLNHQKTIWLHSQHVVVFGTSNWSDASDDNQLEANIFTDKMPGDPSQRFPVHRALKVFERKWNNRGAGRRRSKPWRGGRRRLPPPDRADDLPRHQCDAIRRSAAVHLSAAAAAAAPAAAGARPLWSVYPAHGTITGTLAGAVRTRPPPAARRCGIRICARAKISPALARRPAKSRKTFRRDGGHGLPRLGADAGGGRLACRTIRSTSSSAIRSRRPARRDDADRHASSAEFILQDGAEQRASSAWGWADNGWGVTGPLIYFAAHVVRTRCGSSSARMARSSTRSCSAPNRRL